MVNMTATTMLVEASVFPSGAPFCTNKKAVEKRLYRERAGSESEWEKLPTRRLLNTTSVRA